MGSSYRYGGITADAPTTLIPSHLKPIQFALRGEEECITVNGPILCCGLATHPQRRPPPCLVEVSKGLIVVYTRSQSAADTTDRRYTAAPWYEAVSQKARKFSKQISVYRHDYNKTGVFAVAIDDPISSLQSLNASDERQQSPVLDFADDFLRIVRLLTPAGTDIPVSAIEGAVGWLSRRRSENRAELVDAMAEELKHRGKQIQQLFKESEEHRRFTADETPGLVLDGLRRAEETRARERVRCLGRILVHAAEVDPRKVRIMPRK